MNIEEKESILNELLNFLKDNNITKTNIEENKDKIEQYLNERHLGMGSYIPGVYKIVWYDENNDKHFVGRLVFYNGKNGGWGFNTNEVTLEKKNEGVIKEITDEVSVVEVSEKIPEKLNKVDSKDKDFEEYISLYKGQVDDRFREEYGDMEDKDLWNDLAKEMYLKSKYYVLKGDETKPEKIEESKKVENQSTVKDDIEQYTLDYIESNEDDIDLEDIDTIIDTICEDFAQENDYSYDEIYEYKDIIKTIIKNNLNESKKEEAKFKDKVKAIKKSLKDKDKRLSDKTAEEQATKIAGSMIKNEVKQNEEDGINGIEYTIKFNTINIEDEREVDKLFKILGNAIKQGDVSGQIADHTGFKCIQFDSYEKLNESKSKLTEDSYDKGIFYEIEQAFEEAGLQPSRFSDDGILTRNIGWTVTSPETGKQQQISCDGSWYDEDELDENKKLNEDRKYQALSKGDKFVNPNGVECTITSVDKENLLDGEPQVTYQIGKDYKCYKQSSVKDMLDQNKYIKVTESYDPIESKLPDLAREIQEFMFDFDPYEYRDDYMDDEEAFDDVMNTLITEEGRQTVITKLNEIIEEDTLEEVKDKAKELIDKINAFGKGLE